MLCFPVWADFGDLLPSTTYLQLRRGIAFQSYHFFMGISIGPLRTRHLLFLLALHAHCLDGMVVQVLHNAYLV